MYTIYKSLHCCKHNVFTSRCLVTAPNNVAGLLTANLCPQLPGFIQSELLHNWQFTANQFVLAPTHLRLATRAFFVVATEPLRS
jgi:hypothetical protein